MGRVNASGKVAFLGAWKSVLDNDFECGGAMFARSHSALEKIAVKIALTRSESGSLGSCPQQ